MKTAIGALLCLLFAALALAVTPQKPVIVSYPDDTPESVLDAAKNAILEAGGIITHEYSIIRGFAAEASENLIETIESMGAQHDVLIEEDQPVGINHA